MSPGMLFSDFDFISALLTYKQVHISVSAEDSLIESS